MVSAGGSWGFWLVGLLSLSALAGCRDPAPEPGGGARRGQPASLVETVAPFRSFGVVYDFGNFESMRPRAMGSRGVVATGHYRATLAGIDVLRAGGNAFDAGVAAAMALKVTKMDLAGWAGIAPLILYDAESGEVVTRVGVGPAPAGATLEHFLEHGKTVTNTALVPADVDVWIATLERYGTLSFEEAAGAALELAEGGYHLYKLQQWVIEWHREYIERFPANAEFWFQHSRDNGEERIGDVMVNPGLVRLLRYMIDAERGRVAAGGSREEGLRAARDAFYKGDPARAAAELYAGFDDGLVTYDDMAGFEGEWMAPLSTSFRGYDVYVCDGWSQGPRLVMFLNMLDGVDLASLGYNTPAYVHLLTQVINLGMSDSYRYVGDPGFVEVPEGLYSKDYARKRVGLIDVRKAFWHMPPWGDPANLEAVAPDSPTDFTGAGEPEDGVPRDTSSLNVMDAEGNIFSMTVSDGHTRTPIVPGWGFGLGFRIEQFDLDPGLANVIAPNKRPRNTNIPVLVLKDGEPFMGLSTPGGDQQAQAILQVFLNVIVWGMSPEQAVDQPRFGSFNYPKTGERHYRTPGRVRLENRFPEATYLALRKMGHDARDWGFWNWRAGSLTVTHRDPETGVMTAAGDVRRETSAMGF